MTCGRLDIMSNDLVLLRVMEHGVVSTGSRAVALKCVFLVDKERTKKKADGAFLYLNVPSGDSITERCAVERKREKNSPLLCNELDEMHSDFLSDQQSAFNRVKHHHVV